MVSTPRSSGWGPPGARLATSCARTCSVGSAGVVSSRWRMVRSDAGNGTRRCCISGDGRASPRSGPQSCWSRTRTARGPRRPPAAAQETLRMCVIDSYPPRAPTEREGGGGENEPPQPSPLVRARGVSTAAPRRHQWPRGTPHGRAGSEEVRARDSPQKRGRSRFSRACAAMWAASPPGVSSTVKLVVGSAVVGGGARL
jgi:hypothetical protein